MSIKRESSVESVAEHEFVPQKRQKVVADGDESRAKRHERMAEVRRRSRPEGLEPPEAAPLKQIRLLSDDLAKAEMEGFWSIVSGFWSENDTSNLEATKLLQVQYFTEGTTTEGTTSIEESLKAATVQRLVEFLLQEDSPHLQIEAAWALSLIISQTPKNTVNTVISLPVKAVTTLVYMLESLDEDVFEQAAWALGVIARESPKCRDLVLNKGALNPLLRRLRRGANISAQRTSTWTLSNLCRGAPPPKFQQVKLAVPTIVSLTKSEDDEVKADACWALHYTIKNFPDKVVDLEVSHEIAELLQHPSPSSVSPILKMTEALSHISYETFEDILINGGYSCLRRVLMHDDMKNYPKEVCFVMESFVLAEGEPQLYNKLLEASDQFDILSIFGGLIQSLFPLLQHGEQEINLMASSIILNVISYCTSDQIRMLVNQGCLEVLSNLLVSTNKDLLTDCLKGIEKIVNVGEADKLKGENEYMEILRNTGGLATLIERLRFSKDRDIHERAMDILHINWDLW